MVQSFDRQLGKKKSGRDLDMSKLGIVLIVVILAIGGVGVYFLMSSDGGGANEQPIETAEFEVSNLSLPQDEVAKGDTITAQVEVTNTGNAEGDYTVEIEVGDETLTKDITLDNGESRTVSFDVEKEVEGTYNLNVGGLSENFEVLEPAEFEVSNLQINPSEIKTGEMVEVSVDVKNIGESSGTKEIDFDIGNQTISKSVELEGGENKKVSESVTMETEGTYNVSFAGLSGSFDVHLDWKEIGESYEAADGLTVTLESFDVVEKTGSYQYKINYTLANGTDSSIDEGLFKLYGDNALPQYGFFDELFPEDSITRSYTFEEEKHVTFDILAYHHDQFFADSPPSDALIWKVEY